MADKGKIISQTYYEKQSQLIKLYKESFLRKEMDVNEAITSLRVIGFSEKMSANKVREWAILPDDKSPETERVKRQKLKQQVSLEKYMSRMRLDKKFYKEYMELRKRYKDKKMSKDETVSLLVHSGYGQKFADCTVNKWELEEW